MATKTWGAGSTAGADGLWDTATNWDGDTLPTTGDDVVGDSGLYPNNLTTSPTTPVTLNSFDTTNFPITLTNIYPGPGSYLENINFQSGGYFYCYVPLKTSFTNLQNHPTYGYSFAAALCMTTNSDIGEGQTLLVQSAYVSSYGRDTISSVSGSELQLRKNAILKAYVQCSAPIRYHSSVAQQRIVKNDASATFNGAAGLTRQSQSFTTDGSNYVFNRVVVPMETYKFSIYLADGSGHPTGSSLYSHTFNMKDIFKKTWKELWINASEVTLLPSTQYCAVFDMINHPQLTGVLDWFNTTNYCESGLGEVWSYWTGSAWSNLTTSYKKTFALNKLDDTFVESYWPLVADVVCSCFQTVNNAFPSSLSGQDWFSTTFYPFSNGSITAHKYYKEDSSGQTYNVIQESGLPGGMLKTRINTPRYYDSVLIFLNGPFISNYTGSYIDAANIGGSYFDGIGQSAHIQPVLDIDNSSLSSVANDQFLFMRIDNDSTIGGSSGFAVINDAQIAVYDRTPFGGTNTSKTLNDVSYISTGGVWVNPSYQNATFNAGSTQNNQIYGSNYVDVRCWDGLNFNYRLINAMIGTCPLPSGNLLVGDSLIGVCVNEKIVNKKSGLGAS